MISAGNKWLALQLVIALLLAGCGFQLKGTASNQSSNSMSGEAIAVASAQPRSELTAAVLQQLRLEGADIIERRADALLLRLGAERFQQRNLSLTAQARSAEVELTMSTTISLERTGQSLVAQTEASVVRQFLNDPQNVVGKTEELRLLREEMRRDLAAQITRRLSHSLKP